MRSHRRSAKTSPAAEIRSKLIRVVRGHEQMKTAFHQLKSQIQTGLLQAEDVFASLANPLMQLVGLKTAEMATEGRFTSIIIQPDQSFGTDGSGSGPSGRSGLSEETRQCAKMEIYAAKEAVAGDQVIEKQKDQVMQLVRILKQIESEANNRHSHTVKTLANRRLSLRKFFQKVMAYLSSVDRDDHQGFQMAVTNLLRAIFNEVAAVFGSVEADVEDLVGDLAQKMCEPMVQYVEGVKAEMRGGGCLGLVGLVKEMAKAAEESKAELEAARNMATAAEESRAEAMRKLRESEEYVRKVKDCFKFLAAPKKASNKITKAFASHMILGMEKDTNDEKLLWELLGSKRNYQNLGSPVTPRELLLPSQSNKPQMESNRCLTVPIHQVPGRSLVCWLLGYPWDRPLHFCTLNKGVDSTTNFGDNWYVV